MSRSVTEICNRALQICGSAQRLTNITDTTREGRIVAPAYDPCRRAELRAHTWNFAIARASLAADVAAPLFGPSYRFALPTDCLRVLVPKDTRPDWNVEGRAVVSSSPGPLGIRYVRDIEDATLFDALFCETLSTRIALAVVKDLTNSSADLAEIRQPYRQTLAEAHKANALEHVPEQAADTGWVTSRQFSSRALPGCP